LQGVFEFSEKTAREVMTPRTEMVALPADLTLEEAADQVAVAGRSRYRCTESRSTTSSASCTRRTSSPASARPRVAACAWCSAPPSSFPGRASRDVLADMKRQKIHLAIVLDEFGGTAASSP